ncbi:MAG TPA: plasmid stability protein [Gammaproteobacteria bacterium]|nr:plasmid stability protein [Gammaproteobacteria bacterium]
MPANLTLKNIPDDIYASLKDSAATHHRSLNSEIIVCLERVLMPRRISAEERLERARQLRAGRATVSRNQIARAIRQGRP